MPLELFVKKCHSKVGLAGYDIVFAYFVVEAKSKIFIFFYSYTISDGSGIKITIHDLDLDNKKDFIYIRPGKIEDTNKKGPTLTGFFKEPIRFLIPGSNVFSLQFVSQHGENDTITNKGFLITYSPFGEVLTTTVPPTTTESIVPQEQLQWTRKEVTIPKENQKDSLHKIKEALSEATNLFIGHYNLSFYECNLTNIFIKTRKCPETWPKAADCVNIEFSIPLKFKPAETDDEDEGDFSTSSPLGERMGTTKSTVPTYEMTTRSLNRMWNEFGLKTLADRGIDPYMVPNSFSILLIWISISIAIVGAFIFILYSIWKLDIFKDYRRLSHFGKFRNEDDKDALKKNEFDISMIPSPHQIVPSLFPIAEHPGTNSFENPNFHQNGENRGFEQLTPIVNFNGEFNRHQKLIKN